MNHFQVARACVHLREGGVIAYPTEAVWGLGCDPFDQRAVETLLQLKQRPVDKGMILVTGQMDHFSCFIDPLDDRKQAILRKSWPGPVTWLLPDPVGIPCWIKGEHAKVALRVSTHPAIVALTARFGGPIVSTSANPAGKAPALSALRVRQYFGDNIDGILSGPLGQSGKPTPIYDIEDGVALRI
ncbi:MAG: threonylcarbamoyl-AMP synthase [Gammaproteobacteria bacterium]|nr:MAG: threonylcarbamoyl-AMP synthase [Pseudomonadota bacterium]PIE38303.1 MAG: threonylcarbamoyl-AMP synthase [Gammaproteobacteria bacterium]